MQFKTILWSTPLLALALLNTTASASPQASDPAVSNAPKTLAERALQREKALGLRRIEVGPNAFEYALPPDLETPDVIEKDGLISVYEGQSTFEVHPTPASPQLIVQRQASATSPAEDMIGSVRVDEYGRRWRTVHVDRGGLTDAIARYDALVERTLGAEPGAVSEDPFQRRDPEVVAEGLAMWRPMSWHSEDCDGDAEVDRVAYGSDDRLPTFTEMATEERKVVLIQGPRWGSGVMVDHDTVLTAAHVVSGPTGWPASPLDYEVFTLGNHKPGARMRTVTSITLASGYAGDGDISNDYALLHLSSSPSVGWMAVSSASNSTIRSRPSYTMGYPEWTPYCRWRNVVPGRIVSRAGMRQYWGSGALFGTTSRRVKTRLDGGTGQSGSPYFYFPTGSGWGSAHYVTGIFAGHVDVWSGRDYNGGPKGRAIRSWVIAHM